MDTPRFVPFGPTTRKRQIGAACVVMAGAVPTALIANSVYGRPPRLHVVLITLGLIAVTGWLIDGHRYVGAGMASLFLGISFELGTKTSLDPSALIFGLMGLAVLIVSQVNLRAVRGSAGFLVYLSMNVLWRHPGGATLIPQPGIFALIMLIWGGSQLRRILAEGKDPERVEPEPPGPERERVKT